MDIDIRCVTGADIAPYVDALADLRIEVFRAFPYLYDGSREYEAEYLRTYSESDRSLFVLAMDGDDVVGASTGIPLVDETEACQAPFRGAGIDVRDVFYFGESVLRSRYRGLGIGVSFFREREAYAARIGPYPITAFCAVRRPADHPLRPSEYVPLDEFWSHRGYSPEPGLESVFTWKDVDRAEETAHGMQYWLRRHS